MGHIQDHDHASSFEPHWGYSSRSLPCTNDPGTCKYLDAIYAMHDTSILFSFIMWKTLAVIFLIWVVVRISRWYRQEPSQTVTEIDGKIKTVAPNIFSRISQTRSTYLRRYLLPTCLPSVFGYVSRLQVLILAVLAVYLLVFSLVGIVYQSWITPVESQPGITNTRTGFAGFADRIGVLAFALTPLTVLLSTRESVLMLITGVSYQHFNFLHRWTGRIIFAQALIHSIGWTIIKAYLYQPQPIVYLEFMAQPYIIWGVVAMILISFLLVFSIKRMIKWTGYEFFYVLHVLLAVLYIAACWNHWAPIRCWMVASLVIVLLDFILRKIHIILTHLQFMGKLKRFAPAQANVGIFDDPNGKIIRLEFEHAHNAWKAGQHFYLTFPSISVWQAHPFTVLSSPQPKSYVQKHSYIIRSRLGETSRLCRLASKLESGQTIPVLLTGPYGTNVVPRNRPNILAITGGTGISFALPQLLDAASRSDNGILQLVWIIRRVHNFAWAGPEIEALKAYPQIHIRILVTSGKPEDAEKELSLYLENEEGSDSEIQFPASFLKSSDLVYLGGRPDMNDVISEYLDKVERGRVLVLGSGPPEMGVYTRKAVAALNYGGKVWRGDNRGDVGFYWDY